MIRGITYTDANMTRSADLCFTSMLKNGFDKAQIKTPANISQEFKWTNRDIFKEGGRGAGCHWLFKPYIINEQLNELKDGDILIYSDAGVEWISDPRHIVEVMDQDLFLFSNGHQHVHWCKMDVAAAINGGEDSEPCQGAMSINYTGLQQAQASVIFIRVSPFTRKFIKEWLLWCQMPGFIDDSPSVLPNHPEFAEHRHDQAVLTCMAIKYGIKLHYWADATWYWSQRHRWPDDQYPLMFNHHRKRNADWK